MRILIATGIFTPEVGGPATYTPKIASKLVEAGHKVTVITYSNTDEHESDAKQPFFVVRVRRGNRLAQMYRFFKATFKHSKGADLIYTLDWLAAGIPVMKVAFLRRIPYMVRIGGDYAWDTKYLESGKEPMTLKDFYEKGIYRTSPYRIYFRLVRMVLRRATNVIYNSAQQRELYAKYFGIDDAHSSVIPNPVPLFYWNDIARGQPSYEIVYMGRFVVMKNVESLVRAFAKAKLSNAFTLLLIGDGPQKAALQHLVQKLGVEARVTIMPSMQQHELYHRVRNCRASVLPSWTDISPNTVFEALAIGLPTIVTRENYLSIHDALPEMIDPSSIDDIASKLEMLGDYDRYKVFADAFKAISFSYGWDEATRDHLAIFAKTLQRKA